MSLHGPVDLLIIGGGINGVGIARDAAGRGLTVALCEQGDLASATSSASTKLIHGGLRYLETFNFRLVREALNERDVLLRLAPHIVRPLRFVLPHNGHRRPAWMIRFGLFIYDRLGPRRRLPASKAITLRGHSWGSPLKTDASGGFVYSDCLVDDARLVVLNALCAAEHGARIMTRTKCLAARRDGKLWRVRVGGDGGSVSTITARAIVNAAGPWAGACLDDIFGFAEPNPLRLVKGSHIVVPRLHDGDHAFILQNPDGRVVFVIPYENDFSLIGTTEVDFGGDPASARISPDEIDYLCTSVSRYFARPITRGDVVWSFAGVRPLQNNVSVTASKVTREYRLLVDGDPPVLTVLGGKITTYRKLAEQALERIRPSLDPDMGGPWTAQMPLPGGDIENGDLPGYFHRLENLFPWLPGGVLGRYVRTFGTRTGDLLDGATSLKALGEHLGSGLYEAEVDYLVRREWARTSDDILWRRTKLGLHDDGRTTRRLDDWFAAYAGAAPGTESD
ncbi:MAG: glycerol-3-phosphate dehydrogenase [Sphingomonadales bacterium]